jgi:anthranilate phosphoribosyltransferase
VSVPRGWSAVLGDLLARRELSADDTAWAMDEIMSGSASPAQLASFAVLLRAKGETPQELAGLVRTMLDRAPAVRVAGRAVDIVGTGGDGAHTVNISTMAAVVVAGSGRPVVKHGNRAASSRCGAADVLEELGVAIDLPADGVARTIDEVGIGFCFAQVFHSGLRHAGAPRREIGVPTTFNFLGPLTNPARPAAAAIGCADPQMAGVMAALLAARGDCAAVFRGADGLDELTTTTTSQLWAVQDGTVTEVTVDPADLGLNYSQTGDLAGGDAAQNAAVVRAVLGRAPGPAREAVLLNAGAGIAAFDADLVDAIGGLRRGLAAATEAIDSGRAAAVLNRWVKVSQAIRAQLG